VQSIAIARIARNAAGNIANRAIGRAGRLRHALSRPILAHPQLRGPMFVKLFGSILDSSIWATDLPTRIVWITMLAMADEFGVVHASVGGLTRRAQVSDAECRKALAVLSEPDPDDRSGIERGARIRDIQGGWELINYKKYRELRTQKQVVDAMRQARHRSRSVTSDGDMSPTIVMRHDVTTEAEAEAEEEAEAEANTKSKTTTPKARANARWVQQCGGLWRTRYNSTPPWGRIAKQLAPVQNKPDLLIRFAAYLAATEARYVNLGKFVDTFGAWGNGKPVPQTYKYTPGVSGPEI
jgi:hypothetical protein